MVKNIRLSLLIDECCFAVFYSISFFFPGIVAYRAFTGKEISLKWPPIGTLVAVVACALFYQFVALSLVHFLYDDFSCLFLLILLAGETGEEYSKAVSLLFEHFLSIICYLLLLSLVAFSISKAFLLGIKKKNLHRKWGWLREIENKWYYYFTDDLDKPFDVVRITAGVHMGDLCHLYSGYLKSYTFDKNEEIDLIILTNVWREDLKKEAFCLIESDHFVLSKKEIATLSIQFIRLPKLK